MNKAIDKALNDFILTVTWQNERLITSYLFGSYARGTQKPNSDIDIALVIDNLADSEKFDMQVEFMLLASQFDSRIEPHPISNDDFISGNPFALEVRKTRIEVKPEARSKAYKNKGSANHLAAP